MKTNLLLSLGLSLCCVWSCLGEQTAMARANAGPPPNVDPDRVRAIVQDRAQKLGTKAVLFGMWVHDREVVTLAPGHSMITVPAATEMHYRIGG